MEIANFKIITVDRYSSIVPCGSPYSLHYPVGGIVHAVPKTVGLFCCLSIKDALSWLDILQMEADLKLQIIKVRPLSSPKDIKYVTCGTNLSYLNAFYANPEECAYKIGVSSEIDKFVLYDSIQVLT